VAAKVPSGGRERSIITLCIFLASASPRPEFSRCARFSRLANAFLQLLTATIESWQPAGTWDIVRSRARAKQASVHAPLHSYQLSATGARSDRQFCVFDPRCADR